MTATSTPTHRAQTATLVAMTLANSMILVDQTAVPLATPHAIADLGGSLAISSWVMTASVLPLAALMVFGGLLAQFLTFYWSLLNSAIAAQGLPASPEMIDRGMNFVQRAEQQGLNQVQPPAFFERIIGAFEQDHITGYQLVFMVVAVIALVGAVTSAVLLRTGDRPTHPHRFSRRSRWVWASTGQGPGVSRRPPPVEPA